MSDFASLLEELENMFEEGDSGRDMDEVVQGGETDEMAKSLKLKLDGAEVYAVDMAAVDMADMLKALLTRAERNAAALTKAFAIINARGDMIKALQGDVAKLGAGGCGTKAGEIAKSANGITPDQFFVKAMSALAAGKISGEDIARAESHLNRGLSVPTDIVARVYSDTK